MNTQKLINFYEKSGLSKDEFFDMLYESHFDNKISFDDIVVIARKLDYKLDGSAYLLGKIIF